MADDVAMKKRLKMNKNKRGISDVIATVLLILITITAIAIIWVGVVPIITKNTGGNTACLTAMTQLELVSDYSCINTTDKTMNLQIRAGPKSKEVGLKNIEVIVDSNGNSFMFDILNTTIVISPANPEVPIPNTAKIYTANYSLAGVTGVVSGIQIASVITSNGNPQETCDPSTLVSLPAC